MVKKPGRPTPSRPYAWTSGQRSASAPAGSRARAGPGVHAMPTRFAPASMDTSARSLKSSRTSSSSSSESEVGESERPSSSEGPSSSESPGWRARPRVLAAAAASAAASAARTRRGRAVHPDVSPERDARPHRVVRVGGEVDLATGGAHQEHRVLGPRTDGLLPFEELVAAHAAEEVVERVDASEVVAAVHATHEEDRVQAEEAHVAWTRCRRTAASAAVYPGPSRRWSSRGDARDEDGSATAASRVARSARRSTALFELVGRHEVTAVSRGRSVGKSRR